MCKKNFLVQNVLQNSEGLVMGDVPENNRRMIVITSLITAITTASLLLQINMFLIIQLMQQHENNMINLKDAIIARNMALSRYRRAKLR